jgi:norsolorinic acid ketoreductase
MEPKTTVLITGSNRGIGFGLTERFLAKPSHVVIAAVRNPDHPTAQALHDLPTGLDTELIVVKIDANIDKDAHDAVTELQQKHTIGHLDIVIANAGVEDIKAHMQPNVYGVIALYQATQELLKKSAQEPVFLIMGSSAGLLGYVSLVLHLGFEPQQSVYMLW